jgi:hypothetical protein
VRVWERNRPNVLSMKDDWQHLLVDQLSNAIFVSGKTLQNGAVESELK